MGNSGKELAPTGAFMDKQALSKCKKVEDARLGAGGQVGKAVVWSKGCPVVSMCGDTGT